MTRCWYLPDTITLYELTSNGFGDDVLGAGTQMKALVDGNNTWNHEDFTDKNGGTLQVHISPLDPYYLTKKGRLFGLYMQYSHIAPADDNDWYQVKMITPSFSGYDNSPDLVLLELEKIEAPHVG